MPQSIRQATQWLALRGGIALSFALGLVLIPATSRADRIVLRGGGQIRGKLIAIPTDPSHWSFIGEAGKNPIIYKKEQIQQVTAEKSALDEYVVLRAKDRPLAEEEFQLGTWCDDHALKDLAQHHFEIAIKLDPLYAPAHEKLGHALINDRWLDADGQREAQGMVKYKGRWMTPEEKERIEDQAASVLEGQSWNRRVKALRDAYVTNSGGRSQEAEKKLLAIREANAVGAILRVLGDDPNPTVRALAGRVLGAISGPEASSALVVRVLGENEPAVREATIPEIVRREPDEVVPRLVRALRSQDTSVINRAAWTLGVLNAKTAVPQLIPALTSTEYQTVMVPVNGGGGGGGYGANDNSGFATPAPGFNNYTGSTYLGLTGPVVGQGVVAFGATGVPYGSGVSVGGPGGVSLGAGGNVGGGGGGVVPRIVTIEHPNIEVLGALVKLTGRDYGYNTASWKQWASASFRSDPRPSRRVNQP